MSRQVVNAARGSHRGSVRASAYRPQMDLLIWGKGLRRHLVEAALGEAIGYALQPGVIETGCSRGRRDLGKQEGDISVSRRAGHAVIRHLRLRTPSSGPRRNGQVR